MFTLWHRHGFTKMIMVGAFSCTSFLFSPDQYGQTQKYTVRNGWYWVVQSSPFFVCIISVTTISGWWFRTFFIFHNIYIYIYGIILPSWLIFFKIVETTNQSLLCRSVSTAMTFFACRQYLKFCGEDKGKQHFAAEHPHKHLRIYIYIYNSI